jgi:hypothetical protein
LDLGLWANFRLSKISRLRFEISNLRSQIFSSRSCSDLGTSGLTPRAFPQPTNTIYQIAALSNPEEFLGMNGNCRNAAAAFAQKQVENMFHVGNNFPFRRD